MSDGPYSFSPGEETNPSPDELRLNSATDYAGVSRSVMLGLINRRLVKATMRTLPDGRGIRRRMLLINRSSIDQLMESLANGRNATWRE
jgi:hypothetical protein